MLVLPWTRPVSMVIFSMLLHEWAHVFFAKSFDAKVEHVRLSVFGFIARVRKMDNLHPSQRALVYFAGPAANILVAAWAFTVHQLSYIGVLWLRDLAFYNAVLAVFNLLPLLPLDGGRLVQHFLGNWLGILRANRLLLKLGRGAAIVLAGLGFIQILLFSYNITLLCAGIYLWRKNATLQAELRLECFLTLQKKYAVLRGLRRKNKVKVKILSIPPEMPVIYAVERLGWSYMRVFKAADAIIREEDLLSYILSPEQASVSEALNMPVAHLCNRFSCDILAEK
jgi:Zn-dependent protease